MSYLRVCVCVCVGRACMRLCIQVCEFPPRLCLQHLGLTLYVSASFPWSVSDGSWQALSPLTALSPAGIDGVWGHSSVCFTLGRRSDAPVCCVSLRSRAIAGKPVIPYFPALSVFLPPVGKENPNVISLTSQLFFLLGIQIKRSLKSTWNHTDCIYVPGPK